MKKLLSIVMTAIMIAGFIGCEIAKTDPKVDNVVITPNPGSVARGQSIQFTAVVNGTNNPPQGVTWRVSENSTGTYINSNGMLFVSASEPANGVSVWAASTYDNTKNAGVSVHIYGAIVTSVSISPKNLNLATGSTQQFTATVNGQNNPPQTVNWRVENNNSSSTSINPSGLLTVASNENSSMILVRATSTHDSSKSDDASVSIAAFGGTYNVTNISEWSTAVSTIRNGGNNKIYTINVTGEISLPVNSGSLFGSVSNLQVTLGGGGTLTHSLNGTLVYIGAGQTVIAKNITLKGNPNNQFAVVDVYGGIFRMENGSSVIDNGRNCGVFVAGGTFIMEGGIITNNNNTTDNTGGGVNIKSGGRFIISGNATIQGNRANWGGGVYVSESSNITMNGGTIAANEGVFGGGIHIFGGSFTLNTGEISHNRITGGNGGGVYVNTSSSSFIMNGGSIINNTTSGAGGGVASYIATFTMNGGSIVNNNAGSTGGGVNVHGGTFRKVGGTISSNTSTGQGNTAYKSVSEWRNANAGPNDKSDDYGFWLND